MKAHKTCIGLAALSLFEFLNRQSWCFTVNPATSSAISKLVYIAS